MKKQEKYKLQNFPTKIPVDKRSINVTISIAENFDKYFIYICTKLTKDIGISTKSFNENINKHTTTQPEKVISINEFKNTFFSLKHIKDINFT